MKHALQKCMPVILEVVTLGFIRLGVSDLVVSRTLFAHDLGISDLVSRTLFAHDLGVSDLLVSRTLFARDLSVSDLSFPMTLVLLTLGFI